MPCTHKQIHIVCTHKQIHLHVHTNKYLYYVHTSKYLYYVYRNKYIYMYTQAKTYNKYIYIHTQAKTYIMYTETNTSTCTHNQRPILCTYKQRHIVGTHKQRPILCIQKQRHLYTHTSRTKWPTCFIPMGIHNTHYTIRWKLFIYRYVHKSTNPTNGRLTYTCTYMWGRGNNQNAGFKKFTF